MPKRKRKATFLLLIVLLGMKETIEGENTRTSRREHELRQGNNNRGKDRTMPELLAFRRIKSAGSFRSFGIKFLVPFLLFRLFFRMILLSSFLSHCMQDYTHYNIKYYGIVEIEKQMSNFSEMTIDQFEISGKYLVYASLLQLL